MTKLCRRGLFASALLLPFAPAGHAAVPELKLGVVQFGTVQWVAETIRRRGLDAAHGFVLTLQTLASTEAGRVAIMARSVDAVVSDWPFVAIQRAAGRRLTFAPFSVASGAIMVRAAAPIHTLRDLAGKKLGVAGGPADKSWLLVQAAARAQGADLATSAKIAYGAPPLLAAKLGQGELDGVLTFWNFAARLEAAGHRTAITVEDCARIIGLQARPSLVGYVFSEDWAMSTPGLVDRFLAAATAAEHVLAGSEADWTAIRPMMDAADDRVFDRLRQRFVAGVAHRPSLAEETMQARALFDVLQRQGGSQAMGGLQELPDGIFWPNPGGVG